MDFVSLDDAVYLIGKLGFYIKDPGLLDSALSRPKTTLFGDFAYPTIELMAAAMHQSLVKNHPLVDGNKRTSRFIMNGILMSAGIDAISVPAAKVQEFNEKMVRFYLNKDATEMMEFMVGCYESK